MTKQEQIEIEQFGRDIRVALEQGDFSHLNLRDHDRFITGRTYTATAEALYNAGYQKIPENAVVLTEEEYIDLSRNYVGEQIEMTRKETAKEIYEHIVDSFLMREGNKYFFKKWLQERYGVGYEENN